MKTIGNAAAFAYFRKRLPQYAGSLSAHQIDATLAIQYDFSLDQTMRNGANMAAKPAADVMPFVSSLPRAIAGGFAGTVVFTLMMKVLAPTMIGHPMDIAAVLGTFTGLGTPAGMVMHFLLGSLGFAVGFLIVGPYLLGPVWLRGVIFMVGVWLFVGLVVMPILGVGLFFGGAREAMASLLGHIVLGAVLGMIARLPSHRILEAL